MTKSTESSILDLNNFEILTHEQFWARNPAPGTVYSEIDPTQTDIIVASEINVGEQEPDDILGIGVGRGDIENFKEPFYLVLKWGSWEGNEKYLEMHDEAARLMDKEAIEMGDDFYKHDDCILKRTW